MCLVKNNGRVTLKKGVVHGLAQKHTVGHVLEEGGGGVGHVLETNVVTDLLSELHVHLVGHTLRDRHGGDTTGLGTRDLLSAEVGQVGVADKLGDLGRLSGSGLALHDGDLVLTEDLEELVHLLVDGERLALLENPLVVCREGLELLEGVQLAVLDVS